MNRDAGDGDVFAGNSPRGQADRPFFSGSEIMLAGSVDPEAMGFEIRGDGHLGDAALAAFAEGGNDFGGEKMGVDDQVGFGLADQIDEFFEVEFFPREAKAIGAMAAGAAGFV